jgi:hypothetical protein
MDQRRYQPQGLRKGNPRPRIAHRRGIDQIKRMSDAQNPYQSPSLAAVEESVSPSSPTRDDFARYLTANRCISSALITVGLGLIALSLLMFYCEFHGVRIVVLSHNLGPSTFFCEGLTIALVGILQRRHYLSAMLFSSVMAVAFLFAYLALLMWILNETIRLASQGMLPLMGGIIAFVIFGAVFCLLAWLMLGVFRVMAQAWRWRQARIDLLALEREFALGS